MKSLLVWTLCLIFLSCPVIAEDSDLLIEDIVEEVNLDAVNYGDVEWSFPITLEDMNPEYIRLANKHYLLDQKYVPDSLVKVPRQASKGGISWVDWPDGGHKLQAAASQALCEMNAVMREIDGFRTMYLKSAYRSFSKQKTMYRNRLAKNNGKDDGWVSMPGASDHQTGLGCDVVPSNWKDRGMNDKMLKEPECQWMAEHCAEFGFIIRYPADKQELTEINAEPWHLRYVGIPVAAYIMENGLCLEEFTLELQDAIQDYLNRGGDPAFVEAYIQKPTVE